METQMNRLFNKVWDALFFNIFALFLPIGCTFSLFFVNDKTLYLMLFVTVLGASYNFIPLLGAERISKRLWIESIIVISSLIPTIVICIIKTIIVIQIQGIITYNCIDLIICSCIALLPCSILLYEGVLVIEDDYYMRVRSYCKSKNSTFSLTKSAGKV